MIDHLMHEIMIDAKVVERRLAAQHATRAHVTAPADGACDREAA
jgi:hypothetical protein